MSQFGVDASIKQAYFIAIWSIKYFQNYEIDGYRMESTWVVSC